MALKTELDGLVALIEAGAGVDTSKALLDDIKVRAAEHVALPGIAVQKPVSCHQPCP